MAEDNKEISERTPDPLQRLADIQAGKAGEDLRMPKEAIVTCLTQLTTMGLRIGFNKHVGAIFVELHAHRRVSSDREHQITRLEFNVTHDGTLYEGMPILCWKDEAVEILHVLQKGVVVT